MAEGKGQALWSHTSHVLALIANVNRDPKRTQPFTPADFNPHAASAPKAPAPKVELKSLKATLMGGGLRVRHEKRG